MFIISTDKYVVCCNSLSYLYVYALYIIVMLYIIFILCYLISYLPLKYLRNASWCSATSGNATWHHVMGMLQHATSCYATLRLRTNGVNTDGAAAKVGWREYPKGPSVKSMAFAVYAYIHLSLYIYIYICICICICICIYLSISISLSHYIYIYIYIYV